MGRQRWAEAEELGVCLLCHFPAPQSLWSTQGLSSCSPPCSMGGLSRLCSLWDFPQVPLLSLSRPVSLLHNADNHA